MASSPAHGSALRRGRLGRLEFRLAVERADLDVVFGVVLLARQLLRRAVLRIGPPGAHALLVLELHDGHALAVVGKEAFVRDVARHGGRDLGHAVDQRDVLLARAGPQPGAEHGHDHGTLPSSRRLRRHTTLASSASMSSSDSPKWWPISCTSTWVMIAPSVSSCSAQ